VITPDDEPEFKPSPRPFLKAMEELQVQPDECFVVGDEPVDMIGGKQAGAKTIGLPQGFFTGQELEKAGADRILTSLDMLPRVLPNS
jgi:phosphoglycolate phosphatase-like HAD superfamily hydrolase